MIDILNKIKYLAMDVDGTLTDGKIYFCENGELLKTFNVKDGYGIREILSKYQIIPIIITNKTSNIINNRAVELGVINVFQGALNKYEIIKNFIDKEKMSMKNVAYIGDDMNDHDCMLNCGYKGCPADAIDEIKLIADYICKKNGGDGAVREFIDNIIKYK